jgi:7-cyano-7-deazaguanine synthase
LKKQRLSFIITLGTAEMAQAIVLFSGGIDSTTALYWARAEFEKIQALTFDYGQRHRIEIAFAAKLARHLGISQKIIQVDLRQIGGSSLTDFSLEVPDYQSIEDNPGLPPSTYVPFRNGIFLAMAAAWAEVTGARHLVCGFNVIDSPDYPDTRASFVNAMEQAVNLGTRASCDGSGVTIHAPFVSLKKSEIIKRGLLLGADYTHAISCYSGQEIPCARCPACRLREKAWEETGREDPLMCRLRKEGKL